MKHLLPLLLAGALILPGCKNTEKCVEKPCEGFCTKEYRPVCGCNDKTYGNACEAECHGITEYTEGPCKNEK